MPASRPSVTKALFAVGEPIVLKGERHAFKHEGGINEVQPVRLEIRGSLRLRPSELHRLVYIQNVLASTRLSGITLEITGAQARCERSERTHLCVRVD
jgi:hypothetical protein